MNKKYKCDVCGYMMSIDEKAQWGDVVCPNCFPGMMFVPVKKKAK